MAVSPRYAFKICGAIGLLLGGPLALWLSAHNGLSPWIELTLIAVAVGALLATPLLVKVFTGVDGFVFYRDVICIFAAVWLALRWLHQPVLPYLDVTIAGAGVFHACGRIGCLLSGCCYGRPWHFGICYKHEHSRLGFPEQFIGVRLFPIQAVESAWILVLTGSATFQVSRHAAPGSAFASYVVGYALGRFVFEFARGDSDRPYYLGFSQAQWISLVLISAISGAEFSGSLPFHQWHAFSLALLLAAMLGVTLQRRLAATPRYSLMRPHHMQEIAGALQHIFDRADVAHSAPQICSTSLGIQISGEKIGQPEQSVYHYALSSRNALLPHASARVLAQFILRLRHPFTQSYQLIAGDSGVSHILVSLPEKTAHQI